MHTPIQTVRNLIAIFCMLIFNSLLLTGCTSFSPAAIFPATTTINPDQTTVGSTNKIALLVPLSGELAPAGEAIRDGFFAAYYNANAQQRSAIVVYDSGPAQNIRAVYQQAVNQGASFVVGPLDKQAVQVLRNSGSFGVPTLALNYTDASQPALLNFYEFGQSPQHEAQQAAAQAWQDGYRNALVITPASNWGQHVANAFQTKWSSFGGNIVGSLAVDPTKDLNIAIKNLLRVQNDTSRTDADVIFLAVSPEIARQIKPLLKFYYAGSLPVYATSYVYSGTPAPDADRDIDKVMFCDMPWVIDSTQMASSLYTQLASANLINFKRYARLYALGIDAFNLVAQLRNNPAQLPSGYKGVTGSLTLTQQHQIIGQLPWAQIRSGAPVLIASDNDS